MKINNLIINTITSRYVLNILGLLMLSYFIWYRFIRERMPKEIPFELTELYLYSIICICCIYLYIVFRLIKPKEPSELIQQLSQIFSKVYKPWAVLEDTIKRNQYIQKIYPGVLNYFPRFLRYYKNVDEMFKVYLVINIIPRIMLSIIFGIDIFYFNRLEYVYKFSFLILYVLTCKYIIYSIKKTTEGCVIFLDEWYLVEITSEDTETSNYFVPISNIDWYNTSESFFEWKYLSNKEHWLKVQDFLELQTAAIGFDNTVYSYISSPKINLLEKYSEDNKLDIAYVKSNLKKLDPIISKDFYDSMPIVICLYLAVKKYIFTITENDHVKKLNIMIAIIYLICWSYILFVSFSSVHSLPFLRSIQDVIEPFSGLML